MVRRNFWAVTGVRALRWPCPSVSPSAICLQASSRQASNLNCCFMRGQTSGSSKPKAPMVKGSPRSTSSHADFTLAGARQRFCPVPSNAFAASLPAIWAEATAFAPADGNAGVTGSPSTSRAMTESAGSGAVAGTPMAKRRSVRLSASFWPVASNVAALAGLLSGTFSSPFLGHWKTCK